MELIIGISCGCMPVLPQFVHHFLPKFIRAFSYHRTKVQDFFDRFRSRSTSFHDTKDHQRVPQQKKTRSRFLTLGSFGNNGKGLSTMIRGDLSSALALQSQGKSDECIDLENQRGIKKTIDMETSSSNRTISG